MAEEGEGQPGLVVDVTEALVNILGGLTNGVQAEIGEFGSLQVARHLLDRAEPVPQTLPLRCPCGIGGHLGIGLLATNDGRAVTTSQPPMAHGHLALSPWHPVAVLQLLHRS